MTAYNVRTRPIGAIVRPIAGPIRLTAQPSGRIAYEGENQTVLEGIALLDGEDHFETEDLT